MKKYLFLIWALIFAYGLQAAVFTSTDGNVSLELPNGWQFASKPADGSVLSVVKNTARIDIKKVPDCASEVCAEKKAKIDLENIKSRNMQVVGNSYTGEDIKRMDFATGESLFYISFFTPKNDFSAGYFWIGKQGYSILAKDLSYAQADLIFSFISPANKANQATSQYAMEMDVTSERAYNIESLPDVQEEELTPLEPAPAVSQAHATKSKPSTLASALKKFRFGTSLVNSHMPSYIRKLGIGFDLILLLLVCYVLLQVVVLAIRIWISPKPIRKQTDPTSAYPIHICRRYGTPSLIFRAQDNQGHVFLTLTSRWDSLLTFIGAIIILANLITLAVLGFAQRTNLLTWSSYTFSNIYSACALIIPLGILIFLCGVLWSQFVGRQIAIYNQKGQKIIYIAQKGIPLLQERYIAYLVATKQAFWLQRKRFSILRQWQILDKGHTPFLLIKEQNKLIAILRKLTGHLWGLLRASYVVQSPKGEKLGTIASRHTIFNHSIVDVDIPQAANSSSLLVSAFLINIRDRDRWYPWA